ncbi:MAG: hypothetical protein GY838_17620 [bacterium]|nr:hypothetical protein [bacterium]
MNKMITKNSNSDRQQHKTRRFTRLLLPVIVVAALGLAGCSEDDCVNCVELEPPVVPTGVHSISGDDYVEVRWIEISYHPYQGTESPSIDHYNVYRRVFNEGDENNPDRAFDYLGEVSWDENYISTLGLHYFEDWNAVNGEWYEYAVAAVNEAGVSSALSFELVTDAPLPMSLDPVEIFDAGSSLADRSGWDFSREDQGRVDPNAPATTADIRVFWDDLRGAMMVEAMNADVRIQDFGVFSHGDGTLWFEGVSAAPWDGWSAIGVLELVQNHIYVVEIWDEGAGRLNYAKMGVTEVLDGTATRSIFMHWAYQTIDGLPELIVQPATDPTPESLVLRF